MPWALAARQMNEEVCSRYVASAGCTINMDARFLYRCQCIVSFTLGCCFGFYAIILVGVNVYILIVAS